MFLRTNTVRHRLGHIHEITGRNPMGFEDQAAFTIGLRASDRARGMPGGPTEPAAGVAELQPHPARLRYLH
ncbi:helix-turn-helix domain-containing protein [Mycolicibacterium sp. 120320]|uniref:helix-turn-helix domain-containing protein n=1 Tax=Mycolicibacterium sp. 120320 TaxID=3096110 RepID=UPI002EDB4A1E